jgi:mono/diheme cytochrome c family protein
VRQGAGAASLLRHLTIAAALAATCWGGDIGGHAALAQGATSSTQPAATGAADAKPPEASTEDIDGEQMFATSCGFCHADGGRVAGKGPKLLGTKRSDDFIINRIKTGKPGAMPAFGHVFSEGQIIAILAYIRGLDE